MLPLILNQLGVELAKVVTLDMRHPYIDVLR